VSADKELAITESAKDSIREGIGHILAACHGLEPHPMPRDDRGWVGFELGLRLWTFDLQRVLERAVTFQALGIEAFDMESGSPESRPHAKVVWWVLIGERL